MPTQESSYAPKSPDLSSFYPAASSNIPPLPPPPTSNNTAAPYTFQGQQGQQGQPGFGVGVPPGRHGAPLRYNHNQPQPHHHHHYQQYGGAFQQAAALPPAQPTSAPAYGNNSFYASRVGGGGQLPQQQGQYSQYYPPPQQVQQFIQTSQPQSSFPLQSPNTPATYYSPFPESAPPSSTAYNQSPQQPQQPQQPSVQSQLGAQQQLQESQPQSQSPEQLLPQSPQPRNPTQNPTRNPTRVALAESYQSLETQVTGRVPHKRGPRSIMPPRKISPANAQVDPSPVRTKFPTARIKRIMQADDEVGKVAQQTPIAVGKALELFMVEIVRKSADIAREKNSKRITAPMLKQAVVQKAEWDFLENIVAKVGEEKEGRGSARARPESDSDDEVEEEEVRKKTRGGRKKKALA